MASAAAISILEAAFPQVSAAVVRRCNDPMTASCLGGSLLATPGGRHDFPLDAMSEQLFLSDLHGWRSPHHASDAAIASDAFSFGGPSSN